MTDSQKAALDKLFDTITDVVEHLASVNRREATQQEREEAELRFDYLRTTFPDRVAEILKPKEGEG